MKIERKKNEMIGKFPEWVDSNIVEIFQDGSSRGLYMMSRPPHPPLGYALISLENGRSWSYNTENPFCDADYAIEVKGKFVEE